MLNRRRLLQSFFGFAAGCAVVYCPAAIGKLSTSALQADNSSRTLIELLQNTMDMCHEPQRVGLAVNQYEVNETRRLCQQAINRVRRSSQDTPAFWQACCDSVSRLEAAVSAQMKATPPETLPSSDTLYQLRSLKNQLAIRTIEAIGTPSWLA